MILLRGGQGLCSFSCVGAVGHLELHFVHGLLCKRIRDADAHPTDDIASSWDCWKVAAFTDDSHTDFVNDRGASREN